MTITHHPADETLARCAAGGLPASLELVVRAHAEGCSVCARALGDLEAVGGVLLEESAPAPLSPDAFTRTLALIDARKAAAAAAPRGRVRAELPRGIELPAALARCDVGVWRWVGPGVRISRIRAPGDPDANLMLLRVKGGLKLPLHSHTGVEMTQVLCGGFSDERGSYQPGDFDEADGDVSHTPLVDPEGECISLAAIDGRMRASGMITRVIQTFVGL
jgi:putative transcriptional regulator